MLTDDEASKDFYESHADFLLGLLRGRIPDFIKTAASDGAKKSGKTKSGRPTSVNPGQARPLAIADAIAFLAVEERLIPLHAPAATISKLFGISDKKFSDLREVYKDKEFASIYKNDKSSGQQKRYIYNTNLQVSRLRDIFNHIAVERRADAAMKMLESAARRFRAHQRPRQNKKATKLRGYEEPPPKVATFRGTEK